IGEYKDLVDYNPDPVKLNLAKLNDKDTSYSLTPVITTVSNLTMYTYLVPDTSKQPAAIAKNYQADSYNNKARIFNAHLKEINA
ncbi:MAG: hypothetical protein ACHQF4_10575, partial [Sphingobacteriales bacterium]